METVRLALQQDLHTIHVDETGMRVRGQWWWFHVASNSQWTW
jgi:transposase-like protein